MKGHTETKIDRSNDDHTNSKQNYTQANQVLEISSLCWHLSSREILPTPFGCVREISVWFLQILLYLCCPCSCWWPRTDLSSECIVILHSARIQKSIVKWSENPSFVLPNYFQLNLFSFVCYPFHLLRFGRALFACQNRSSTLFLSIECAWIAVGHGTGWTYSLVSHE